MQQSERPTPIGGNKKCDCGSGKTCGRCDCEAESWANNPPETWENYGLVDPSLRFSVGQRVECWNVDVVWFEENKWIPGRVVHLKKLTAHPDKDEQVEVAYEVFPDDHTRHSRLMILDDTPQYIRPFEFTPKSSKHKCSNCCVDDVKLSTCSRCKRAYYCSRKCQKERTEV